MSTPLPLSDLALRRSLGTSEPNSPPGRERHRNGTVVITEDLPAAVLPRNVREFLGP